MNNSLSEFGGGATGPSGGLVGIANAANIRDPPVRENIGSWKYPDTEYGLTTHRNTKGGSAGDGKVSPQIAYEQHVRWVSGGDLGKYVEEYGDELVSIPSTYSGFENLKPYLGVVDGTIDGYGYGIDGRAAERALRVLIDNGRYSASSYHIIACGEHPWLLIGDEGVLLCSLTPVSRTEAIARTTGVAIPEGHLEVEEERPEVLEAIHRIAAFAGGTLPRGVSSGATNELSDEKAIEFTGHKSVPSPSTSSSSYGRHGHTFYRGEDNTTDILREDLIPLGTMVLDQADLPGVTSPERVTSPTGPQSVRVEADVERKIGTIHDEGLVIGYSFDWQTYEYGPEAVATITTYHLDISALPTKIVIQKTHNRVATVPVPRNSAK